MCIFLHPICQSLCQRALKAATNPSEQRAKVIGSSETVMCRMQEQDSLSVQTLSCF